MHIDNVTMAKIKSLFLEKQEMDEKELYEQATNQFEAGYREKVMPSKYEDEKPSYRPVRYEVDSEKNRPVENWQEYEQYVQENMIETIDTENLFLDRITMDRLDQIESFSN